MPDGISTSESVSVKVEVNGRSVRAHIPARLLLADFLRDVCGQTGTHLGCEHGVCGACTVLLDGQSVRSCLLFAVQAHDHTVTTVEGLASDGSLSPLQQAFWERHALQCAFCTSGILVSATELLDSESPPSDEQIVEAIAGHVCRCTGYEPIVEAVRDVAAGMPRP